MVLGLSYSAANAFSMFSATNPAVIDTLGTCASDREWGESNNSNTCFFLIGFATVAAELEDATGTEGPEVVVLEVAAAAAPVAVAVAVSMLATFWAFAASSLATSSALRDVEASRGLFLPAVALEPSALDSAALALACAFSFSFSFCRSAFFLARFASFASFFASAFASSLASAQITCQIRRENYLFIIKVRYITVIPDTLGNYSHRSLGWWLSAGQHSQQRQSHHHYSALR